MINSKETCVRKFRVKCEKSWGWHIGLFFCVEPKSEVTGKHDIYLLVCLGKRELSIGMLTEYDDEDTFV